MTGYEHRECDRCGTEIGFNEVFYGVEVIICAMCQWEIEEREKENGNEQTI